MRAVIFANGVISDPQQARYAIQPGDLIISADGGLRHCQALNITPNLLVGDLDSVSQEALASLARKHVEIISYPTHKDYTDLELAIQHARDRGAEEIIILGALGARWDQTLANLLLPAAPGFEHLTIHLLDGFQEITLAKPGLMHKILGQAGDSVSLVPVSGDAGGITTKGLEYPLHEETLQFGVTRGISNVLLAQEGEVFLKQGLLLIVVIHQPHNGTPRSLSE